MMLINEAHSKLKRYNEYCLHYNLVAEACYRKLNEIKQKKGRFYYYKEFTHDFAGEIFRVLKEKEIRQYGEYHTRRLIIQAWDRLFGKET